MAVATWSDALFHGLQTDSLGERIWSRRQTKQGSKIPRIFWCRSGPKIGSVRIVLQKINGDGKPLNSGPKRDFFRQKSTAPEQGGCLNEAFTLSHRFAADGPRGNGSRPTERGADETPSALLGGERGLPNRNPAVIAPSPVTSRGFKRNPRSFLRLENCSHALEDSASTERSRGTGDTIDIKGRTAHHARTGSRTAERCIAIIKSPVWTCWNS